MPDRHFPPRPAPATIASSRPLDRRAAPGGDPVSEPARPDAWNPDQYGRFRAERSQPFFDLLELVRARPGMRVVDLGCGTGELTAAMHRRLEARETVGV